MISAALLRSIPHGYSIFFNFFQYKKVDSSLFYYWLIFVLVTSQPSGYNS